MSKVNFEKNMYIFFLAHHPNIGLPVGYREGADNAPLGRRGPVLVPHSTHRGHGRVLLTAVVPLKKKEYDWAKVVIIHWQIFFDICKQMLLLISLLDTRYESSRRIGIA